MRIGIVNASRTAAEALSRHILDEGRHKIAWLARSGEEAIAACAHDRPDALLLDIALPGLGAVETARRVMAKTPCAVVVVSRSIDDARAKVFEAMGAGALDAVNEPASPSAVRALLEKLGMISKIVPRPAGQGPSRPAPPPPGEPLVVIGASAGGPAALSKVLPALPAHFKAPVIVIQHVDPQFADGLVGWMNNFSQLPVRLAREGERPQPGAVLVAARDDHLVFTSATRLGYTRAPVECSYRPSVDVFFKSVNRHWKGPVAAVLLTGMGRDGAEGLRLLRESGHHTIAQDRLSSAVYGMPKAAADLKAAAEILALDKIGPRLANIFASGKTAP
jgi:chemotaxis response regulator CheB